MIPAAIVTFHPDEGWPARLDAVLREHARVVVVDNSTSPEARGFVTATLSTRPGTSLIAHSDNPGIGAALNLAFASLSAEGRSRVVAYDQDSTPAPGFGEALAATAATRPRAAVVGANWTDPRRPGHPALFLRPAGPFGLGFRRAPANTDLGGLLCVITSGALFDLEVWRDLGGFDEGLFLDLVDTDYCLRARHAGHDIAASARAILLHHRGEKRPARLLGRDYHPAHTPPFRLRCLTRNRLILFRRNRLRPVAWTVYELAYAFKLVADALLFEPHKRARFAAMLRGVLDGLLGRTGPVRPS
jgi:rhamnosyltransferase